MPLTVADIMDTDTLTVSPEDTVDHVLRTMRDMELAGVPVVTDGGRCVGIITESDLVMTGEDADLHLPHYFELFGGFVSSSHSGTSRSACATQPLRWRAT